MVPAARTVLIEGDGVVSSSAIDSLLASWDPLQELSSRISEHFTIPVTYDGIDLQEVAELTGLSTQEVIELHTSAVMSVAFFGFMPGFAYISGLPEQLNVPRRDEPRTVVAAGSVAIAAEYTGIYPKKSPGGWRVIGRTDIVMWEPSRHPPPLLTIGASIRFVVER
jgi:KipI family sensor histidine kinase inhibitor